MKKSGGQIIIEYLIRQGVEYIAGVQGHGCLSVFDAIRENEEKGKIKYIQVKQEMSAVHIADGYYRACGKPMAILTSIGPGALNTSIGVATAYVDSTPCFVISGDTHVHMRGTGVLQEIERQHDTDFINCMRPITKRCWRVEDITQLPSIMRRAFSTMMDGRKGPVAISVPMDVQAESMKYDVDKEPVCKRLNAFMATQDTIDDACRLLKTARRPVIVLGGGALYARKPELLVELAEKIGAAVVTTMAGKGAFPENHDLYAWHAGSRGTDIGNHMTREADVILALGCRFADQTTSSYRKGVTFNFPDTKLIQVDIDPAELGKNYRCDIAILGDVNCVARQLIDSFAGSREDYHQTVYFAELKEKRNEWFAKYAEYGKNKNLTVLQVVDELNRVFPKDGYVSTSSATTQIEVFQGYRCDVPGTHITTGGFSTMGWSMPAAIGVQLAKPDKKVISFTGDGDFLMTCQELSVAVQYKLPLIIAVMNNSGWMAIKALQISSYGDDAFTFANDFRYDADKSRYYVDYAKLANSFGMKSETICKREDVAPALQRAINAKEPVLLEFMVSNAFPYGDGESFGWWDMPMPAYIPGNKREEYLQGKSEEFQ